MNKIATSALGMALCLSPLAQAVEIQVEMHQITAQGIGPSIGTIAAHDSDKGLLLKPDLKRLPPGTHGFHVHENPSCSPGEKDGKPAAGIGAGNHYDPKATGKHAGPDGDGHLGDLPPLSVAADGTHNKGGVLAPRLKLADLKGRSLIIHADPDNFADKPGGARIACGIVE